MPFAGVQSKRKPRVWGILTHRNWFSLKEVSAVIAILSAGGPGAIVSVFIILLWGGGKRHQGFLQAFPIKVGEGSPSFFSQNLSLEGTPDHPLFLAAYRRRSVKALPNPPTSPLRREGPSTPGPQRWLRGAQKGEGQARDRGENDLAKEERKKEVRGCAAPQLCTEKRRR